MIKENTFMIYDLLLSDCTFFKNIFGHGVSKILLFRPAKRTCNPRTPWWTKQTNHSQLTTAFHSTSPWHKTATYSHALTELSLFLITLQSIYEHVTIEHGHHLTSLISAISLRRAERIKVCVCFCKIVIGFLFIELSG